MSAPAPVLDQDDSDEGEEEQSEVEDFYDEESAGDDEDEEMDAPDSDDGDEDFGVKKKKPKAPPKVKLTAPKIKRESKSWHVASLTPATGYFPTRKAQSESSDEDYAKKSHKKKAFRKPETGSARGTPESGFADSMGVWRRGAAKKVVTYDEAQADYGLESEDDAMPYGSGVGTPG